MEVLIALATIIAYVYSVIVVIVNMILKVPSPMAFFDVAPSKLNKYSYGDFFFYINCFF